MQQQQLASRWAAAYQTDRARVSNEIKETSLEFIGFAGLFVDCSKVANLGL